jgi:hypothetical protein
VAGNGVGVTWVTSHEIVFFRLSVDGCQVFEIFRTGFE